MNDLVERLKKAAELMPDTWVVVTNTEEIINVDISMKEAAIYIQHLEWQNSEMRRTFGSYPLFQEKDARIEELERECSRLTAIINSK